METHTYEQLKGMTGDELLGFVRELNGAYDKLKTRADKLSKWKPGIGITNVDAQNKRTPLIIKYEGVETPCTCYIKDGADGVGITNVNCITNPAPGTDGKYQIVVDNGKKSVEITTKQGPKGEKGESLDGTEYYGNGWVKKKKTVAGADMSANAVKGSITGASFGATAMSASLSIANIGFACATNALTVVYNTFGVAKNDNAGSANEAGEGEPEGGPLPGNPPA